MPFRRNPARRRAPHDHADRIAERPRDAALQHVGGSRREHRQSLSAQRIHFSGPRRKRDNLQLSRHCGRDRAKSRRAAPPRAAPRRSSGADRHRTRTLRSHVSGGDPHRRRAGSRLPAAVFGPARRLPSADRIDPEVVVGQGCCDLREVGGFALRAS